MAEKEKVKLVDTLLTVVGIAGFAFISATVLFVVATVVSGNPTATAPSKAEKLSQLGVDLKSAVTEERYEDAAKIRDEIKTFETVS